MQCYMLFFYGDSKVVRDLDVLFGSARVTRCLVWESSRECPWRHPEDIHLERDGPSAVLSSKACAVAADPQATEALTSKEQLQQQLQQQLDALQQQLQQQQKQQEEQQQQKEQIETALREKEEALKNSLSAQQLQREGIEQQHQQQESKEESLPASSTIEGGFFVLQQRLHAALCWGSCLAAGPLPYLRMLLFCALYCSARETTPRAGAHAGAAAGASERVPSKAAAAKAAA